MQNKTILGLVGLMASGKGTIAQYLVNNYLASTFRFSTMLRDVLERLHIDITRHNMITLSTNLREKFGEDLMAKVIAADVKKEENTLIAVDGIRREADTKFLMEIPGFVLVRVVAEPKTRYERIVKRTENDGDTKKTFEEFMEDHKKETEISIPPIMKMAEHKIDNNGSIEELKSNVDSLLYRIKRLTK